MVGGRIRTLRKQRGLKISELAELIGVTSGYISQIERDLIEPSLPVLRRLAKSMDVLLASLFSDEFFSDIVVMKNENRKQVHFADSNIIYEFLSPSKTNNTRLTKMEVVRAELGAKQKDVEEFVSHSSDEFAIVMNGYVEYHVESDIYSLSKGDSIYLPGGTPHLVYNPGTTKAVVISAQSQTTEATPILKGDKNA